MWNMKWYLSHVRQFEIPELKFTVDVSFCVYLWHFWGFTIALASLSLSLSRFRFLSLSLLHCSFIAFADTFFCSITLSLSLFFTRAQSLSSHFLSLCLLIFSLFLLSVAIFLSQPLHTLYRLLSTFLHSLPLPVFLSFSFRYIWIFLLLSSKCEAYRYVTHG